MSENEDDGSVDSKGNIRDLIADSDVPKRKYTIRTNYHRSKRPRPPPSPSTQEYSTEETPVTTEESEPEQTPKRSGIFLSFGGFPNNNMVSKKYNMKRESKNVQLFYSLITETDEENTIDSQIAYFKNMDKREQDRLLIALENRTHISRDLGGLDLMLKILSLDVSSDTQSMILSKYHNLQKLDKSSTEYYKLLTWLEKVTTIPFGTYRDIPARIEDGHALCNVFMNNAKKCLDMAIYGQEESKLQILQFISTKISNPSSNGASILLVGPPGIGKTSLIKNGIAQALGWPFQLISLGGDSDASTYTGHQPVYESSHCGKITNSLIQAKSMSMVVLFDELDKISTTDKGQEIMNLLVHLTDPVQNNHFEDKYFSGIPIDLSKVMFVFSANDITKIDKILLDRMLVIQLKGYDNRQKTIIAEKYLLPIALKSVNLVERVVISKEILANIIETYSGSERGVRELNRCIEHVTQKLNMLRMYNEPELPFHIKDFQLPFTVKREHLGLFLKKKDEDDISKSMYV